METEIKKMKTNKKADTSRKKMTSAQRKKKMNVLKRKRRLLILAIAVVATAIVIGILALCGVFTKQAAQNTISIDSKGRIIFEEVENFQNSSYDKNEIKEYVKKTVTDYNNASNKKQIKIQKINFDKNKVYIKTRYASVDVYEDFTGYELFAGTIKEAVKAGYTFDASFVQVKEGVAKKTVSSEIATKKASQKVMILRENCNVHVNDASVCLSKQYKSYR